MSEITGGFEESNSFDANGGNDDVEGNGGWLSDGVTGFTDSSGSSGGSSYCIN